MRTESLVIDEISYTTKSKNFQNTEKFVYKQKMKLFCPITYFLLTFLAPYETDMIQSSAGYLLQKLFTVLWLARRVSFWGAADVYFTFGKVSL